MNMSILEESHRKLIEHLEERGVGGLAGIGWDDVASFFVVDGAPARGASSADALRAIFRAGLSFDETIQLTRRRRTVRA